MTVAEVVSRQPLRIADLSRHKDLLHSPFVVEDFVGAARNQSILERLANELARPVSPQAVNVDYVPTQYLTEVILNDGFDGIGYPSGLGTGQNLVLFDAAKIDVRNPGLRRVTAVEYKHRRMHQRHHGET